MAVTDDGGNPKHGHAAGYTFYQRNGQTIMRSSVNRRSDKGRTGKAMAARTKVSNINSAWRAFRGELKGCFERQRPGQTDNNVFVSQNLTNARVFLSQRLSGDHACVADNFCVSFGSLQPVIQVVEEEDWLVSDILYGSDPLTRETRVGEVAYNIVRENKGAFRFGDELVFVRLSQRFEAQAEKPYCMSYVARIQLDRNDSRPMGMLLEQRGGGDPMMGFKLKEGRLATERMEDSLVAWIRLRKGSRGEQLATTQSLVGTNSLIERYTSWEAREEAIHSYGELKKEEFLNPAQYEPYETKEFPELNKQ